MLLLVESLLTPGQLLASDITASSNASLTGRILEEGLDDFGVEGVRVCLASSEQCTATKEDGSFLITNLPPEGDILLSLQATDYRSRQVLVPHDRRHLPLLVTMQWSGEAPLSVTVVATRTRPETASTTRLSPEEIASAPHRNAEEILRQVPGLTLVQHGSEGKGHQFFLRGFDAVHGADLEIRLDGIHLNEWSNIHAQGYLDLAILLPEMIQEVVVTKGPFTLDQGAFGMAGTVDYQTGIPVEELGWRASYTASTTNRHRLFAGYSPPSGHGERFVGLELMHDDGFGRNRQIDRATFNSRLRLLDTDHGSTLYMTVLAHHAMFDLPGTLRNQDVIAGDVDFYDAYDPLSEGTSTRTITALHYERTRASQRLRVTGYTGYRRLDLLENFTGYLLDPVHGDRKRQRQRTLSFGVSATHEARLNASLSLRSALGLRGDAFTQREQNVGRALDLVATRRDLEAAQLIAHLLTGARWTPRDTLRLDAGARLDTIHVTTRDLLDARSTHRGTILVASPRVSARWTASKALRLFLAYGHGFRPPEARAFSSFEPNRGGLGDEEIAPATDAPDVTTSKAAEAGARWDVNPWLALSASSFLTLIERESIFDHVSGLNLELHGTRRLGTEFVIHTKPAPWLTLSADLTLTDARFMSSGHRVPFAPWLVSGLRGTLTPGDRLRSGIRLLAVAPRPLPHGATGSTYLMTDLTLGYHFEHLHLDLAIENLFDQRMREGEYHYASRWSPDEPLSEIPALHMSAAPPFNARLTLGVLF